MARDRHASPAAWTIGRDDEPIRVRFLGRGAPRHPQDLQSHLAPPPDSVSWLRQVHSARVRDAVSGDAGEGDALITDRRGRALSIATADCVPVLFATPERLAAAHAGWRGLVEGVIAATLERLGSDPSTTLAWIGPSIGACCYEVGDDVAGRIADASTADVVSTPDGRRAHADLQAAAVHQLSTHGVERIQQLELCTRCHPDILWSYRRQGAAAGRNWSVIWRD